MPGKAAIQAAFGRRRVWTRKGPFSCPSVAMSVRTRPMFAIPFAVNLGSVAVISRRCGILGCNERAHGPPMFAIPTPDVCRSLQIHRRLSQAEEHACDGELLEGRDEAGYRLGERPEAK